VATIISGIPKNPPKLPVAFTANGSILSAWSPVQKTDEFPLDRVLAENGKMARFDDDELEDMKRRTDIVRLITSYGVTLKERGGDELIGLCPVHDDKNPSLVVNRKKNVWNCLGACKRGGSVIDWVMHAHNVSFRHAFELLKDGATGGTIAARAGKPRILDCPLSTDGDDQALLRSVIDYYHNRLKQSPSGLEYLDKRGIVHAEIIDTFKIGFVDRTLGLRLPAKSNQKGSKMREDLERLGILRDTGHEQFRGCIVFPLYAMDGTIAQIYGRRIDRGTKEGFRHFYLPSPHAGIFNREALKVYEEIILCESVIDAATFWNHGYRNVTSTFGTNGFTDELIDAIQNSDIKRILIAFDNDEAGNKAADEVAAMLQMIGIEVFRIKFPAGQDANEYAMKVQFAKEGNGDTTLASLGLAIRNATWINSGKKEPIVTSNETKIIRQAGGMRREAVGKPEQPAAKEEKGSEPQASSLTPQASEKPSLLAAESAPKAASKKLSACEMFDEAERRVAERKAADPIGSERTFRDILGPKLGEAKPVVSQPEASASGPVAKQAEVAKQQPAASPMPAVAKATVDAEVRDNEIIVLIGNRSYRVRGLEKNLAFDVLKVNVLVRKNEQFYIDTFDIYAARQRHIFVKEGARELCIDEETIKRDLGKVLLKLEELQDKTIADAQAVKQEKIEITDADKAAAMELLKDPNLIERILADFDACGVVGEETNKLVGYLAATSRKLAQPLAVLIQSSSAAGKSSLMEAVLSFMPREDTIKYSAMTGQSLFYMGGITLKHRILAIAEEEGVEQAAYALKLLQSEGQLNIASTGKDPGTGRMETQEYHVEGPVMIFLTTTSDETDPELKNRCITLGVCEHACHTEAIHKQQRSKRTFDGQQTQHERKAIRSLHQNAQRLLRPMLVINNFADQLAFRSDKTTSRRAHDHYLTLIEAVTLLHQYQRKEGSMTNDAGEVVRYVETTLQDIEIANRLADRFLERSFAELPERTQVLLEQIIGGVKNIAEFQSIELGEVHFTRKDVRRWSTFGDTQLKQHLARLVDYEYLRIEPTPKDRGKTIVYSLSYDPASNPTMKSESGLVDVNRLRITPPAPPTTDEAAKVGSESGPEPSKVGPPSEIVAPEKIDSINENTDQTPNVGETGENEQKGAA
jgi:DNA primase catalytic core